MADFGDPTLFEEFDKPRAPCDKLLLAKLTDGFSGRGGASGSEDDRIGIATNGGVAFQVGFSGESQSESASETESTDSDNEDSDHGDDHNGRTVLSTEQSQGNHVETIKRFGTKVTAAQNGPGDDLDQKVKQLNKENELLKKQVHLLDPSKYIGKEDEEGPAIEVLFLNHSLARKYRAEIERYINHLVEQDRFAGKLLSAELRENNVLLSGKPERLLMPDEKIKQLHRSTVIGCSQFFRDFLVDTMGWPLIDCRTEATEGWEVPKYEQIYTDPLPCDEDDESCPQPQKKKRPKASCFNCGGDHRINDCTEPRNQARISSALREHKAQMAEFGANNQKQTRYHAEVEERFSVYKPGRLSDELYEALGITRQELPPFIYQMRILGYPPGWLKEAEVEGSGLAMFDKHGKEISMGEEDGEQQDNEPPKAQYDFDKFVEYAGFNVAVPGGVTDNHNKYGMPAMQPHHNKSFMENMLTPKTPGSGRKRSLPQSGRGSSTKKQKTAHNASDMDLDDSGLVEEPIITGEPSSGQLSRVSSVASQLSGQDTPSLEELERQRQLIEFALLNPDDSSQDTADSSPTEGFVPPLPPTPVSTPVRPPLPEGTPPVTPSPVCSQPPLDASTPLSLRRLPTMDIETCSESNISLHSSSRSLLVEFGTPILKDVPSKVDSLPDPEKFSQGVIQHIPYENLPGATGTYNKMRDVFDRIKKEREEEESL